MYMSLGRFRFRFLLNCTLAPLRNQEVAKYFQSDQDFYSGASLLVIVETLICWHCFFPIVTSQQSQRWNVNSQSPTGTHVKVNFEFLPLPPLPQIYSEAVCNRKNVQCHLLLKCNEVYSSYCFCSVVLREMLILAGFEKKKTRCSRKRILTAVIIDICVCLSALVYAYTHIFLHISMKISYADLQRLGCGALLEVCSVAVLLFLCVSY